jgi:hypothetical protein
MRLITIHIFLAMTVIDASAWDLPWMCLLPEKTADLPPGKPAVHLLLVTSNFLLIPYNFGNLLTTTAAVGSSPRSPTFISAGAGPVFFGADWYTQMGVSMVAFLRSR